MDSPNLILVQSNNTHSRSAVDDEPTKAPPEVELQVKQSPTASFVGVKPEVGNPSRRSLRSKRKRSSSFTSSTNNVTSFEDVCVFCLRAAPQELKSFTHSIPGAGCDTMRKHLQVFFVVHNILNLPVSWSERILQGGIMPDLQCWLGVCEKCFPHVDMAWKLHQRVLYIQSQIHELKEILKGRIVDSRNGPPQGAGNINNDGGLLREMREASISFEEGELPKIVECKGSVGRKRRLKTPSQKEKHDPSEPWTSKDVDDDENEASSNALTSFLGDDDNGGGDEFLSAPADVSDTDWEEERVSPKKRKKSGGGGLGSKRNRDAKGKDQLSRYKRKLRCNMCPAKYAQGDDDKLKRHLEAHERCKEVDIFVCKKCKFPSESEAELEKHLQERHSKTIKQEEKQCKVCPFTSFTKYRLLEHIKEKHSDLPPEKTGLNEFSLICEVCKKKTGNFSALSRHKRIFHPELFGFKVPPESLLVCEECGEKFDNQVRFDQHKRHHQDKGNILKVTCEHCGKRYPNNAKLRTHMSSAHELFRPYICQTCSADFKSNHNLNRHRQIHHPEELEPDMVDPSIIRKRPEDLVRCKICKIEVPVALRRRHMKTHLDPEKAFKCDECDRSYFKLQGLKKHKEINHSNGATKVNCEFCNKECIHPEYLRWHYRYCAVKKTTERQTVNPVNRDSNSNSNSNESVPIVKTEISGGTEVAAAENIVLVPHTSQITHEIVTGK